jgi:hypothetical protein
MCDPTCGVDVVRAHPPLFFLALYNAQRPIPRTPGATVWVPGDGLSPSGSMGRPCRNCFDLPHTIRAAVRLRTDVWIGGSLWLGWRSSRTIDGLISRNQLRMRPILFFPVTSINYRGTSDLHVSDEVKYGVTGLAVLCFCGFLPLFCFCFWSGF